MSRTTFFLLAAAAVIGLSDVATSAIGALSEPAVAVETGALDSAHSTHTGSTPVLAHDERQAHLQDRGATRADEYAARAARIRRSL